MKKMKMSAVIVLFCALVIPTMQSCKKYPDGPFISFRTRTERVSHSWKVDNYKRNGTDYTSTMSNYTETYTKDGDYSFSWGIFGSAGKWAFQNNDKEIGLKGVSNHSAQTLVILKLEDKEFWYYYMDGSDKNEFHMIRN
jgi:hypothetical protein